MKYMIKFYNIYLFDKGSSWGRDSGARDLDLESPEHHFASDEHTVSIQYQHRL